ncbi:hypothetical protein M231_05974 [Tremella mesenterica]|uniref:BTB domain-containing protein n=1 Tax=Tremella mesenterica TaxID=5217 RepID=A0A4Q1BGP5_TREME|nr:hypothetical protein M231_05974 [Tremella mesenterica]
MLSPRNFINARSPSPYSPNHRQATMTSLTEVIPKVVYTVMEEVKERVTFDAEFDDPTANVILTSDTGVKFRVHGWHIKRKSDLIADMLSTSNSRDGIPAFAEIDVAAPTDVLRHFVRLCYTPFPAPSHFTLREVEILLAICDHLGCIGVKNQVLDLYASNAYKDPVGTFVLAARLDHLPLARACIGAFDEAPNLPFAPLSSVPMEQANVIPGTWWLELIRHRQHHEHLGVYTIRKWDDVAGMFYPGQRVNGMSG